MLMKIFPKIKLNETSDVVELACSYCKAFCMVTFI